MSEEETDQHVGIIILCRVGAVAGVAAAVSVAFYLSDRVRPGRSVLWGERL